MTLRHIKIFLAVCDCDCNTTKAADMLFMTQPAVSLAIKELEQYYGVVLFDRIGRRLRISEAGLHFKEYAVPISALFDDMEKGMRNWDAFGVLRVGASITIGAQFLPGYVRAFKEINPHTEIKAVIEPTDLLEEKVMNNELDFALIEGIAHNPSLVMERYMDDDLVIICPADGSFQQDQVLSLEEFKQQKFLLREPGSGTRQVFDRTIAGAGISIQPVWEAMSTSSLVNGVINGLGIAVLPRRMVSGPLAQGLIVTVRVEELDFKRRFKILYHKEKYLTASAKSFLNLCRHFEENNPDMTYRTVLM